MIPHTQAYDRFRAEGIALYDYAVLLSFAVPCLEKEIKKISGAVKGKLPRSRYIKNDSITAEELLVRISNAGDTLGKEILLTTFSYFEAYVSEALKEMIDFHGGEKRLQDMCRKHLLSQDKSLSSRAIESRKKIQEYPKANLMPKYKKHNRVLIVEACPLPSQRAAAYGWKALAEVAKNFKAHKIPDVIFDGFLVPITDTERSEFHTLRDKRNKIAHGKLHRYPVRIAITHGKFLRDLAVRIDKHIVENFLLIEVPADQL